MRYEYLTLFDNINTTFSTLTDDYTYLQLWILSDDDAFKPPTESASNQYRDNFSDEKIELSLDLCSRELSIKTPITRNTTGCIIPLIYLNGNPYKETLTVKTTSQNTEAYFVFQEDYQAHMLVITLKENLIKETKNNYPDFKNTIIKGLDDNVIIDSNFKGMWKSLDGDNKITTYNNVSYKNVGTSCPIDICFPKNTPVLTDRGYKAIHKLVPGKDTIRGNPIKHVTKTRTYEQNLVLIKENSLGYQKPSANTITTQKHKIYYKGNMIEAGKLAKRKIHGVSLIPYKNNILYNIILDDYTFMYVNNIKVETLDPKSAISKLWTNNVKFRHIRPCIERSMRKMSTL